MSFRAALSQVYLSALRCPTVYLSALHCPPVCLSALHCPKVCIRAALSQSTSFRAALPESLSPLCNVPNVPLGNLPPNQDEITRTATKALGDDQHHTVAGLSTDMSTPHLAVDTIHRKPTYRHVQTPFCGGHHPDPVLWWTSARPVLWWTPSTESPLTDMPRPRFVVDTIQTQFCGGHHRSKTHLPTCPDPVLWWTPSTESPPVRHRTTCTTASSRTMQQTPR